MKISTDGKYLYIKFSLVEKILGIHESFIIPIEDIVEIHTREPHQSFKEIKIPGTFFPRIIKAGTYFTERGREFWYVTRNKPFLSIELKSGFYKRIILSIAKSESIKNKIHDKISPNNSKK